MVQVRIIKAIILINRIKSNQSMGRISQIKDLELEILVVILTICNRIEYVDRKYQTVILKILISYSMKLMII